MSFPLCTRRTAMFLGGGGLVAALALPKSRATQAQDDSTLEANKAVVHRVFAEIVNGGDTVVINALYAPVFLDLARPARRLPHPAGMPVSLDEFRAVFPDIIATIEDMIAEGDLVATRVMWPRAPYATSHPIPGRTMHLSRIANGRIVEEWSVGWDSLEHHLNQFFRRELAP